MMVNPLRRLDELLDRRRTAVRNRYVTPRDTERTQPFNVCSVFHAQIDNVRDPGDSESLVFFRG